MVWLRAMVLRSVGVEDSPPTKSVCSILPTAHHLRAGAPITHSRPLFLPFIHPNSWRGRSRKFGRFFVLWSTYCSGAHTVSSNRSMLLRTYRRVRWPTGRRGVVTQKGGEEMDFTERNRNCRRRRRRCRRRNDRNERRNCLRRARRQCRNNN
jgi:hypothetical protein